MKKWTYGMLAGLAVALACAVINNYTDHLIPDFMSGWISCCAFGMFYLRGKI